VARARLPGGKIAGLREGRDVRTPFCPVSLPVPTNDCIPEAIMTSDLAWAVQ